ncbi:ATPase [bacterium]|nr:ATPase [bacterium]
MDISVQVKVEATIKSVWSAWTTPEDITKWNFASPEWCCPRAEIELRNGGKFSYRMEARDGSVGFDFAGEFTMVDPLKRIEFSLGEERNVKVIFSEIAGGTIVEEIFTAENENSAERQRHGWQMILNNFKSHVESQK